VLSVYRRAGVKFSSEISYPRLCQRYGFNSALPMPASPSPTQRQRGWAASHEKRTASAGEYVNLAQSGLGKWVCYGTFDVHLHAHELAHDVRGPEEKGVVYVVQKNKTPPRVSLPHSARHGHTGRTDLFTNWIISGLQTTPVLARWMAAPTACLRALPAVSQGFVTTGEIGYPSVTTRVRNPARVSSRLA